MDTSLALSCEKLDKYVKYECSMASSVQALGPAELELDVVKTVLKIANRGLICQRKFILDLI